MKRLPAFALLIALVTFECVRGVMPALSRIDTDFPNYLTAAKIVADRRNPDRLYDDAWFREQMRGYGMHTRSSFSPFPPPTALVLVPLAGLQPLSALRVMTALNVLCLFGAALLLARVLGWGVIESAVFVLLSGDAIISCLRFGQIYMVISTLCILGYYAYLKGRPWVAGVCFGLFAPIKYLPIIYPAYLASRRQWKVGLGALLTILAVALTSVAVLGWKIHETFLLSVLGNHLIAHLGQQDPFTTAFQSFDSLFRRLFVLDPTLNPHPFRVAPLAQIICTALAKTVIVVATATALFQLSRGEKNAGIAPSVGILGVMVMLIAPATATYHFTLLWLPVGLLVQHFYSQGARLAAYFLVGAYTLIGFFPYKLTYPFEGRGGLTILAYPRLFILAAMFAVCVYCALVQSRRTRPFPAFPAAEQP
jgi:hypothetical protein